MTTGANSWKLVIHGGAGAIERQQTTAELDSAIREGLQNALDVGSAILRSGGAALDAVENAVRVLEDDPHFNAGRGSVFTHGGRIELDAAVMDGRDRSGGAVSGVTATRNPVSLARAVMERTPHVFLAGAGADAFSVEQGFEQVAQQWFETDERRRQLQALLAREENAFDAKVKYGTVGAVAVDRQGHVAAATSTGGLTGKRWGRVGDTPLIGAGTYANALAAVSGTGTGEAFIRAVAAHQVAERLRLGSSLQEAIDLTLADIGTLDGVGGLIAVSAKREAAWGFTTPGMYRGMANPEGRTVALYSESDER